MKDENKEFLFHSGMMILSMVTGYVMGIGLF